MVLPALAIPIAAAITGGVASAAAGKFFSGTPEKKENVPTLRKDQEPLYRQLQEAGMGPDKRGSFGAASDYYRNILNDHDDQRNYNDLSAPMMRQYNEDIIPGLSEQFAGMGAGGLSSSGFRNAQVQGGVDLAERLGSLRAQLRQQGDQMRMNAAQGLTGIGQAGLQNFSQNMTTQQGSPGFLSNIMPAFGNALGTGAAKYSMDWLNSGSNSAVPTTAGSGYSAGVNAATGT